MPGTGNGRKHYNIGGTGEIEFNIKSNKLASHSVNFWPRLSENETFYDGPYIAEF